MNRIDRLIFENSTYGAFGRCNPKISQEIQEETIKKLREIIFVMNNSELTVQEENTSPID